MEDTVAAINAGKHLAEKSRIEQLLTVYCPQFLKYWKFVRSIRDKS
jgi:hypothetical protein